MVAHVRTLLARGIKVDILPPAALPKPPRLESESFTPVGMRRCPRGGELLKKGEHCKLCRKPITRRGSV